MIWVIGGLFLALAVILIAVVFKISSQVNDRLAQMNQSILEANKLIGQNLSNSGNVVTKVYEKLGVLEESSRQIYEVGKNVSSLQDLLRAPKFRGEIGETLLENLLSQVLPKENYSIQYRFKTSDAVDAVIKLGERLVPIDAKFSLENFQRFVESSDEQAKNTYHKKFIQDVKNRVDEIASKYILPQENTYDFAFMYIPAENVYYEIIIKEDILSYFSSKRVIPVSPNTFYAYLQIICLGLKGLKIEENAKVILKNLSGLAVEIGKLKDDFDILGTHIANAKTKYDDTEKRLEKFSDKLVNIQDRKQIDLKE